MNDEENYRMIMYQKARRRTILLTLVCLVLTVIGVLCYLIFTEEKDDRNVAYEAASYSEEERKPTEGEKEKTSGSYVVHLDLKDSVSPILESFSRYRHFMEIINSERDAIRERDEYIEELETELDEVYSFIDEINGWLGGINVIKQSEQQ